MVLSFYKRNCWRCRFFKPDQTVRSDFQNCGRYHLWWSEVYSALYMASPLTDLLLGARERQRVAVMEVLRRGVVWFIMVLMLTCSGCVSGEMLRVGGSQGWKTDVNYTEWSSQQHFYVGLWLCNSLSLSSVIPIARAFGISPVLLKQKRKLLFNL